MPIWLFNSLEEESANPFIEASSKEFYMNVNNRVYFQMAC